nr:hypothetical protein [Tanacetum cinerariifolium]
MANRISSNSQLRLGVRIVGSVSEMVGKWYGTVGCRGNALGKMCSKSQRRKHLKNKNEEDAKMDLSCVEGKIHVCVDYPNMNDASENSKFLAFIFYKKIDNNRIVHKIYHVSLDKEEQETWMKFKELAESITALKEIRYPIREEDLTTVKKDYNLVGFIGEYAVMPLRSPVGWYCCWNLTIKLTINSYEYAADMI